MPESDIPSDAQDPRRTEIGNRIDPSLAKGFVRQMLQRAELQMKMPRAKDLGDFRNAKARMRAIAKLKKSYAAKFISAVASTDYTRADIVLFDTRVRDGNRRVMGIITPRFDFTDQEKMPASHWIEYPFQSIGTCAYLTEHTMIRLAQRGGAKTFEDFMALMKPIWAWASVAHEISQTFESDFHWFLPVPNGLFAIRTSRSVQREQGFVMTEAKTYIDKSDMRPSNQEVWDRLTGLGILDVMPRFPRLSHPKPEEVSMLAAMVSEGKKWHDRYEYAVKKGSDTEPDPFE